MRPSTVVQSGMPGGESSRGPAKIQLTSFSGKQYVSLRSDIRALLGTDQRSLGTFHCFVELRTPDRMVG